jgi:hypothetical protein
MIESANVDTLSADPTNLSPALAAMVATIVVPYQYAKFVEVTVASLNSQCKSRILNIGK